MNMVNAFSGDASALSAADRSLLERRRKALGAAYRLFYREPLHLVRGEGVWLYDAAGRRYLDAYNNVASLGHGHPEVVEAIARQAAILNTHTRYLDETVVACAEALLATFPDPLSNVMFTCTGSEANDLALRIARAATGGEGVIVTDWAYHGVTLATAEASPSLGPGNPLGSRVWTVPAPRDGRDADAARFEAGVARALAAMEEAGVRPAALLLDTTLSSDGVFVDPVGLLGGAVERARAAGALFIADEVQAGFGRLGPAFWGFARHGLTPDLVTLGKPMGNGHPVAAVVAQPDLTAAFGRQVRYFNTFAGNPVSSAAAHAVLRVIARDRLDLRAEAMGALLRTGIEALATRRPAIAEVRGAGLFIGVDLRDEGGAPDPAAAGAVVDAMRRAGVLISAIGPGANVLKIRPPLVFEADHVKMLLHALDEALTAH